MFFCAIFPFSLPHAATRLVLILASLAQLALLKHLLQIQRGQFWHFTANSYISWLIWGGILVVYADEKATLWLIGCNVSLEQPHKQTSGADG